MLVVEVICEFRLYDLPMDWGHAMYSYVCIQYYTFSNRLEITDNKGKNILINNT